MKAQKLTLESDQLRVNIHVDDVGQVLLQSIEPLSGKINLESFPKRRFDHSLLPLTQVRVDCHGNASYKTSTSLIGSTDSLNLRYESHELRSDDLSKSLDVVLKDSETGVSVNSHLQIYNGIPVLRSHVTIQNDSHKPHDLYQVSSLVVPAMARCPSWWHKYSVSYARNTWFREAQWDTQTLSSLGIDDFGIYDIPDPKDASLANFSLSNDSTFSTQGHLNMGALHGPGHTWMWQVESNAAWTWEIGDFRDNVYLATAGSTRGWSLVLQPGSSHTTCPTALACVNGDFEEAMSALTAYRRTIIRPHKDHTDLPVIFNDYMNCLLGDPNEEKILALIQPVVDAGAEYFVIDAGWYADDSDWWDGVGEWVPSTKRFPKGFSWLIGEIEKKGLKPGLWLEPEVIGVKSPLASKLPLEAFFQRNGQRVVEKGRYQLNYKHPLVRQHMDEVVSRLIETCHVKYFKFDYNIQTSLGTDTANGSSAEGQAEHCLAYLAWVKQTLDRYPELVIENCSSGGQRLDYAMLSVHTLQSTSDQQDPVRYAAIAAACPTAVIPEQSATWAYPQPDWSDEINALTVVNSLLGRIHLSGRLDLLSASQHQLVAEGMQVYKEYRSRIPYFKPFWPLGLPKWHDEWLALGMWSSAASGEAEAFISVWRRGGPTTMSLPMSNLGSRKVSVQVLYPVSMEAEVNWDSSDRALLVKLPEHICARLLKISMH
ncbi:putative Melibiase subfamily [Kockovaella imperatae]|uniref:alpha-galactosidase n=1 Tax=Kockovaella imperatae TaxID=4999 RepID=A0A1Y1UQ68_9TREE|nr:putative Melibiase subfamily [Kockovaella imperatae]ORX40208.1 putative Melibiase subfamily [Kockovaella imperatae]